jgi:hypothetical protein
MLAIRLLAVVTWQREGMLGHHVVASDDPDGTEMRTLRGASASTWGAVLELTKRSLVPFVHKRLIFLKLIEKFRWEPPHL